MRVLLLVFSITFLLPTVGFSQDMRGDIQYQEVNPNKESGGFSLVDQWPMYPGGEMGINEHIKKELKYPKEAMNDSIQGRVVIRYIIQTDGSVSEIEVVVSVHPLLDAEAKRVIGAMKKWKPAIQRGKAIKTAYEQDFYFKL